MVELADLDFGRARLEKEDRDALAEYAAQAAWPAGFGIYQRGAPADGLFVVARGRVVLRSRVRASRGFVPWVAGPGETFGSEGLSSSRRYATDARADEEAETLFLSTARFRAFVREQPQHSLALISQLLAERASLLDRLRELTTLSVEQRVVATLVRMARDETFEREDGRIVLCPARYRLLCELVGATRESVSLVLGRLIHGGLVERRGQMLLVSPAEQLADRLDSGIEAEIPISAGNRRTRAGPSVARRRGERDPAPVGCIFDALAAAPRGDVIGHLHTRAWSFLRRRWPSCLSPGSHFAPGTFERSNDCQPIGALSVPTASWSAPRGSRSLVRMPRRCCCCTVPATLPRPFAISARRSSRTASTWRRRCCRGTDGRSTHSGVRAPPTG